MKMVKMKGRIALSFIRTMLEPRMQFKRIIADLFHASMIECLDECFQFPFLFFYQPVLAPC
jgi:hypothetical protein